MGAYSQSLSPYGTFDQGGNVWEWNEEVDHASSARGLNGGSWIDGSFFVVASNQPFIADPASDAHTVGFRVARIHEPVVPIGDFDLDSDVDGADFLKWQKGELPNPLSSSDLDNWRASFGNVASSATATTIPEPSNIVLLLITCTCCLLKQRVI